MASRKKATPGAQGSRPAPAKKRAKAPPAAQSVSPTPSASPAQPPPEPPRPTSPADAGCQAWVDYVCTHGGGFVAQPGEPGDEAGQLPTVSPPRVVARIQSLSGARTAVPEGTPGGPVPVAGGEGLDRLMREEGAGVYYEVVEGVPVAALTRAELERSRGVALDAYEVGRASRNVRPRKQDRYDFIHQLVTAGEEDWAAILRAVLAHNSAWVTKKGRPVKPRTLQNGYRLWLRKRRRA